MSCKQDPVEERNIKLGARLKYTNEISGVHIQLKFPMQKCNKWKAITRYILHTSRKYNGVVRGELITFLNHISLTFFSG